MVQHLEGQALGLGHVGQHKKPAWDHGEGIDHNCGARTDGVAHEGEGGRHEGAEEPLCTERGRHSHPPAHCNERLLRVLGCGYRGLGAHCCASLGSFGVWGVDRGEDMTYVADISTITLLNAFISTVTLLDALGRPFKILGV